MQVNADACPQRLERALGPLELELQAVTSVGNQTPVLCRSGTQSNWGPSLQSSLAFSRLLDFCPTPLPFLPFLSLTVPDWYTAMAATADARTTPCSEEMTDYSNPYLVCHFPFEKNALLRG